MHQVNGSLVMAGQLFRPLRGILFALAFFPLREILFGRRYGWLEVIPQVILLAFILHYWVNHPEKKWLNWVLGILFTLLMAKVGLGLLVG